MSPLIDGRLPIAVVRQRYELLLTVEPDRGEFSGSVAVQVQVREPVRAITLHALELTVPRAVVEAGGARFPALVSVDPDSETITLTPDREVPAGPAGRPPGFWGRPERPRGGAWGAAGRGGRRAVTPIRPAAAPPRVSVFCRPT